MNKHLRLSFIAIACSLAITACSSDNKGATRYEDLVKNKVDEANKKAEEKAKKDKESETAKKLAELEKKQKELEQQLKQKNQEAPKTEPKQEDMPKVEPKEDDAPKSNPQKEYDYSKISSEFNKTFIPKTPIDGVSQVSGGILEIKDGNVVSTEVKNETNNHNELFIDGIKITLFSKDDIASSYNTPPQGIKSIQEYSGKVGTLTSRKAGYDFNQLRYGAVTVNNKNILFVQGHITPIQDTVISPYNHYSYIADSNSKETLRAMPTTGSFKYNGYALYGKDATYETLTAEAIADIDNKKIKVELKKDSEIKATLGGAITNNTFQGKHNGIEMKGAFYGSSARDIGGIFYDTNGENKGNNGVFGATQGDSYSGNKIEKDSLKNFEIK